MVVRERTDGAGDENVLSPPRRDSMPPFAVRLVPAREDAPCDAAVTDREVSWSVDIVGAMDREVGGDRPSTSMEDRRDPSWSRDAVVDVVALLAVETEGQPFSLGSTIPILPDCGYGLLFLEGRDLEDVLFLTGLGVVCRLPSPEDAALKLASFFIKLEKGRRRPGRSGRSGSMLVCIVRDRAWWKHGCGRRWRGSSYHAQPGATFLSWLPLSTWSGLLCDWMFSLDKQTAAGLETNVFGCGILNDGR